MKPKKSAAETGYREARTTVGLKQSTKEKLDRNRAPGQCYDGFICQMVDLWERARSEKKS
jgi:hypothetical protein